MDRRRRKKDGRIKEIKTKFKKKEKKKKEKKRCERNREKMGVVDDCGEMGWKLSGRGQLTRVRLKGEEEKVKKESIDERVCGWDMKRSKDWRTQFIFKQSLFHCSSLRMAQVLI